jgi:prevent-host-death family protein
MTIHVNIGEAKNRLSELVAAAVRGEDVILQKAGEPQVKLVPVAEAEQTAREELARRRVANIGIFRDKYAGIDMTVPPSMTDEEIEERFRRKFGEASD